MKSAKEWAVTMPGYYEGDVYAELTDWIGTIQADALETAATVVENETIEVA